MNKPTSTSVISSLKHALNGIYILFKTERNAKIHLTFSLLVLICGVFLKVSSTEWAILILCITSVMALEGVNSAIEKICDFIHPEKHDKIKHIKDISAGAVLLAALGSATIGLFIFIPKTLLIW